MPAAESVNRIRNSLLRWYRRVRRDLPWRRTDDPYAIWVSEVMLQQTQVTTVIPFYERFLERFPDPTSLAGAAEDEVLAAWSGLGYYRRARGLHAGARMIVEEHGGRVPDDPDALRRIPGIGRYTAGAISSIAFGLREPILDGNVRRVFSRLHAFDASSLTRAAEERWLWERSGEWVRGRSPGDLNQALMEFGALVCTPRAPGCSGCPVAADCRAQLLGRVDRYPISRAARATETIRVGVAWIRRAGKILLEHPSDASPLRGTWDLPAARLADGATAGPVLAETIAGRHRLELRPGERIERFNHGILHRRLKLEVIECRLGSGRVAGRQDLRWCDLRQLDQAAVSGATLKIARRFASEQASSAPAADHAAAATHKTGRRTPRARPTTR